MRFREPVDPNYGIGHIEYASGPIFDPSKIKGNTYPCGAVTLVRIPKIDGKISERNQEDRTYIEYIYTTWYDPETKQNRNRKKIIGRYIDFFPGFMIPNENYSLYFDFETGKELPRPKEEEDDTTTSTTTKEKTEFRNPTDQTPTPNPKTKKSTTQSPENTQSKTDNPTSNTTPMTYDPNKKLTAQGHKELVSALLQAQQQQQQEEARKAIEEAKISEDEEERRWAEEREQYIAYKEHFELIRSIFNEIYDTIQKQARKRPNAVVSLYTIQRINETIAEIQDLLKDSEVENYIILLNEPQEAEPEQEEKEEPEPEEKESKTTQTTKTKRSAKASPQMTGLTYSDVEIILGQISSTLHWFAVNRMRSYY